MLYIFDNTETLLTTLPEGSFFDAIHHDVLNGENTFHFSFPADQSDAQYIIEGNLVGFKDLESYWQIFEIKRIVDQHVGGLIRTAYCEHILYELLDDIVIDKRPSADATAALDGMLENSRWQVGIVDDLGTASTNAYYEPALSAVQKVANAWHGELNWRCVVTGGVITRYVDLRAMVGTDTGKQFVYSKDIINIEREVDSSSVVTALYGRGKGIETESGEGYGRRLTFASVVAPDKPAGQEWVGDSDALARWGRNGRHRFDVFVDEEEIDPIVLLEKTRAELARRKVPRVTYRLDVVNLEELTGYEHEKVRKGDLVRVIDREFKPELVVSARVIDIERDKLDLANAKVVLGSFAPTIIEATINTARRVDEMANRPFNTKWLDGRISVLQNAIESAMSNWWTDENGNIIFESQDGLSAMKLAGEGFAIANSKTGDTWNWRTFGNGSGFTADLITTGILNAALVQIGQATTFEAGYDPTQISSASMGVDANCNALFHFDGSLNSHKGLALTFARNSIAYLSDGSQVAAGQPRFETGVFGKGFFIEEGTVNVVLNPTFINAASWVFETNCGGAFTQSNGYGKITAPAAGYSYIRQTISTTINVGDTYVFHAKFKNNTTGRVGLRLVFANASTTEEAFSNVVLNGAGGTVTVSAKLTATQSRTTIYCDFCIGTGYYADSAPFSEFSFAQCEKKPYPTSFMVGTRPNETATIPNAIDPRKGTISIWHKWDNLNQIYGKYVLCNNVAYNAANNLTLYFGPSGGAGSLYVRLPDNTKVTKYFPMSAITSNWQMCTVVYDADAGILDLAIDGTLVTDGQAVNISTLNLNTTLHLSGSMGSMTYGANGLRDELRIDKVAHTESEISGWYKAKAPFYTSEDMKQWPGYLKAVTDGIEIYDSEGNLRVKLGSWLKNLLRKYGVKIIDGEIYSSLIRSGSEDATTYIQLVPPSTLQVYKDGNKLVEIDTTSNQGRIKFFVSGTEAGQVGGANSSDLWVGNMNGKLYLHGQTAIECNYNMKVYGDLSCTGAKPAQQVTDNYGLRYMYATEAPELVYYDRGRAQLVNGEATIYLDPIYLECIEPDTDLTPWLFKTEVYGLGEDIRVTEWGSDYFKVQEENGGTSNRNFGWWHEAIRKGYAGIRLMEVV